MTFRATTHICMSKDAQVLPIKYCAALPASDRFVDFSPQACILGGLLVGPLRTALNPCVRAQLEIACMKFRGHARCCILTIILPFGGGLHCACAACPPAS